MGYAPSAVIRMSVRALGGIDFQADGFAFIFGCDHLKVQRKKLDHSPLQWVLEL